MSYRFKYNGKYLHVLEGRSSKGHSVLELKKQRISSGTKDRNSRF